MDTGWGCLAGVADSSNDWADQQERGEGGGTSWARNRPGCRDRMGPGSATRMVSGVSSGSQYTV